MRTWLRRSRSARMSGRSSGIVRGDLDFFLAGLQLDHVQDTLGDPGEGHALEAEAHLAQLDIGDRQEILHEAVEPLGVPRDRGEEFLRRLPVLDGPLLQRLDEAQDGRQRRLDLVGHVGHEIDPHALQFLEARHVVEDEHRLALGRIDAPHRGDAHVEHDGFILAQFDLLRDGHAAAAVLVEGLLQAEIAEGLQRGLPDDVAVALPDHGPHAPVHRFDPPLVIEDQDPVQGAGEGRLDLGLLLLQGRDPSSGARPPCS